MPSSCGLRLRLSGLAKPSAAVALGSWEWLVADPENSQAGLAPPWQLPPGPSCLGGLERKDHVVRNVRLIGHWLKAFLDVAADFRRQAPPEPSGGRVLVLEGDFPTARMSADGRLCRRATNACEALRADDEELV